jgi:hypothetical protein
MPIKRFLAHAAARRDKHRLPHRRSNTKIASKVVIRKPVPWQRRLLYGLVIALAVGAIGYGLFIAGQMSVGFNSFRTLGRIRDLSTENDTLRDSNTKLTDAYNSVTTQLNIERGARNTLEAQVSKLEDERSQLNRDLALFDNLFPTSGQGSLPTIRGFRVEPVVAAGANSAWRYHILVMRGGKSEGTFKGTFRLQVRYRQAGQEIHAQTPANGNITEAMEFQRYRRIEGDFQAPPGAAMLGATAQLVQNGRIIAESAFRP